MSSVSCLLIVHCYRLEKDASGNSHVISEEEIRKEKEKCLRGADGKEGEGRNRLDILTENEEEEAEKSRNCMMSCSVRPSRQAGGWAGLGGGLGASGGGERRGDGPGRRGGGLVELARGWREGRRVGCCCNKYLINQD